MNSDRLLTLRSVTERRIRGAGSFPVAARGPIRSPGFAPAFEVKFPNRILNWWKFIRVCRCTFVMISLLIGLILSSCQQGRLISPIAREFSDAHAGARSHAAIVTRFGGMYRNPRLGRYLAEITKRLSLASSLSNYVYTVTVIDSSVVNAFSLPGGFIYLTRGMIALANDESELASVIAHEIAHILGRHAYGRRALKQKLHNIQARMERPGPKHSPTDAAFSPEDTLAQYTRQLELAADREGLSIMRIAGYDPMGALRIMQSLDRHNTNLKRQLGVETQGTIGTTHPAFSSRLKNLKRIQNGSPHNRRNIRRRSRPTLKNRRLYAIRISGVPFEDVHRHGVIRGNRYIDLRHGVRVEAPEGFRLGMVSNALYGTSKYGLTFRMDSFPARSPVDLNALALRNFQIESETKIPVTERTRIAGLPAVKTTVQRKGWFAQEYLFALEEVVFRIMFVSKNITSLQTEKVNSVLDTFSLVEGREVENVHPLLVRPMKAPRTNPADALIGRMATTKESRMVFLLLNGLNSVKEIVPGGVYKVVVE